jgi:hypothetical protein
MEDSIISFVNRSKADLLIYYARNKNAKIDDLDAQRICQLVAHYKTTNYTQLNLLIHTLGGNINSAIDLVEFLRSAYPDKLQSIVMVVAKSSGSFMSLCADECFMQTSSVLSDFTLDQTQMATSAYTDAQRRSTLLAFKGICGRMDWEFWVNNFAFHSGPHGQSIPKAGLLPKKYVTKLEKFPGRTKALGHVHNEIIKLFKSDPNVKKVYGINEALFKAFD